jgi:uncharacterized membrane protein YhhN
MLLTIVVAALVSLVHLVTQVVAPDGRLADVTQVLLMPALAAVLAAGTRRPRSRLTVLALVALGFSWLGDTVPRFVGGDAGFLSMVGFFLVAQVVYAVAFWPWRDASVLRRPALLAPYVVGVGGLVVWVASDAGAMAVAVIAYGLAIVSMAVLATGLGRIAALGGIVFMVSDAMIALRAFADLDLWLGGLWVMSTYIAAQALLVWAVLSADARPDAPAHSPGA